MRDHWWSLDLLASFYVRGGLKLLLEVDLAQLVQREILVNHLVENWSLAGAQLVRGFDLPLVRLF